MPVLEDGQVFERYRVHTWLGNGISGESYEAEDRILQRKVTLKLIHPWAMLPDSARRQFFREMQGISLLNHPYLATVLDYGEVEGRLYIARRYVSSGSLLNTDGRLWFRPPLPVADAFTYAHQLAQALQYMHQHGYLHGALTFANVLVLRGPHAKDETGYAPFLVADAGLAHFVRRFGHPLITTPPVSAAPEQLSQHVTPASDQFALAVLLYFWLTGRPPYLGTSDEIAQQKLSATITPLNTLNPGINTEQENIIRRALAVDPDDRFASILEFGEALLTSLTAPTAPPQSSEPSIEISTSYPATPREFASSSPQETTFHAQPASTDQQGASTPPEAPAPVTESPATSAEIHPSALEQLLARPEETDTPQTEITGNNWPAPPETPRLEENALQTTPVPLALSELTETPIEQGSSPSGEETPIHPNQAGEPADEKAVEVTPEIGPLPLENAITSSEEMLADTSPGEMPPGDEESNLLLFPIELPDSEEIMPALPPAELLGSDEAYAPLAHEDEAAFENAETTLAASTPDQENAWQAGTEEKAGVPETSSEISPASTVESESEIIPEEIEESCATSSETYPLLDEVTVAPRLLISSPYTHSSYEFLLTGEEITIGRAGASDLYLEQDNLTSRHHALLKRVGERVLIFDRRSYNGVFINGQKIEAGQGYELTDGDHIGIGNYELIFRSTPASHVPQLI